MLPNNTVSMQQKTGPTKRNRKVLIVVAGGGFYFESQFLLNRLTRHFECFVLTSGDVDVSCVPPTHRCQIGNMFSLNLSGHPLKKIWRVIRSFVELGPLIVRIKPDVIVWVGAAMGLPAALWCKALGGKVVMIESITRVNSASLTGRILERMRIADRLYVQHPDALKAYKKAVYKGWIL